MAITVTVAPSTTKLIALADLKAILGITDSANDTLLGNIIQRGSDAIARFCNRVFAQRTVIETLPGTGGQLLKLKFFPIVTLTSIAYDGDTVDGDTYTLTEPDAGMVYREAGWFYTGHAYDYAATYTHDYNLPDMSGADTLPYDIQQAALELCKGMWLARQRDPAVSMESVPDVYTVQYGGQGNGGALVGAIPLNVQELLLPYRPKPNTHDTSRKVIILRVGWGLVTNRVPPGTKTATSINSTS